MHQFFNNAFVAVLLIILAAGKPSAASAADSDGTEVVPRNEQISDFDARRGLAQTLAEHKETLDQAVQEYKRLLEQKPDLAGLAIEAAQVFIRAGKRKRAFTLCAKAADMAGESPEKSIRLARAYVSLGHTSAAISMLRKALSAGVKKAEKPLTIGSIYESCGFFYKAEALYREYLASHPQDREGWRSLAGVLRSSGRTAEAEGIYRSILQRSNSPSPEIQLALAQLRFKQKRFASAVKFAEKVLKSGDSGLRDKAHLLTARAHFREGELPEAKNLFDELRQDTSVQEIKLKSIIGCGRIYEKRGEEGSAQECFKAAETLQNTARTRYLNTPKERRSKDAFLEDVEALCNDRADKFFEWGQTFAENDQNDFAISCLEKALELEPGYSRARIRLIQVLASERRYKDALQHLESLASSLKSSRKLTILKARILSWNQAYEKSLDTYEKLHRQNRKDPVPVTEMARVASWAKQMPRAFAYYEKLLAPPVDRQLSEALQNIMNDQPAEALSKAYKRLEETLNDDNVYDGYRQFRAASDDVCAAVSSEQQQEIKRILVDLLPAYLIQRRTTLELRAKRHVYHDRLLHARNELQDLLDISPGNQEARFMLGQVQCRLGLCDAAADTYERILEVNASHNLAKRAFEASRAQHRPALFLRQKYWHERGRGELSGIDTFRTTAGVDIPVFCRLNLKLSGHHWYERGDVQDETATATGGTLSLEGKLNAWLRFRLSATYKDYKESAYEDQHLGSAAIWADVYDYAQVGMGVKRETELYNTFGIRQGVTSDTHWLSLELQPVRRVSVDAKLRGTEYSDDNRGTFHDLSVGYKISRHPRTLKFILHGEYRDTEEENVFQINSRNRLQNIVHPYWTPRDYTAWDVILEWRHDISEQFFCGNDLHFYDIRVGVGSDSDNNPGATLEGTWHYELSNHWTFELSGLLHESEDWDATGLWGRAKYRF